MQKVKIIKKILSAKQYIKEKLPAQIKPAQNHINKEIN